MTIRFSVAVLVLLLAVSVSRAGELTVLHVAPDGDDAATGTADQPLRTPAAARDVVRKMRAANGNALPGPVEIRFADGVYRLDETFMLRPDDSGSEGAPVSYVAAENAKPVFSGGVPVTGWKATGPTGAWVAPLPTELAHLPGPPREMWADTRRTRARHPNDGYFSFTDFPGPPHEWNQGHHSARFTAGDFKPSDNPVGAELILFNLWNESRVPVTGIDLKDRRLDFGKPSMAALKPGTKFYLEGLPAYLDAPGEWTTSADGKSVLYLPRPGETPETFRAVLPRLVTVMKLAGDASANRAIHPITFRGITFAHAEFNLDSPGAPPTSGFPQAAIGVPGIVVGEGMTDVTFDRCTFTDSGTYGLTLAKGSQRNRVSRCLFIRLGAGGICLGDKELPANDALATRDNVVSDCTISHNGHLYPSGIGVWIGQASNNRVAHNAISEQFYSAISVGWTWGYGPSAAGGNVIEHNDIHHIGRRSAGEEVLADMAGVYTLGHQPGTVIRGNRIHDLYARDYGGWGIYLDEGSRDVVVENNLVYRTSHGGFHQHYGQDNTVRNNVFAFGRDNQIRLTRPEPDHRSFTFERNIVLFDQGDLTAGVWDGARVAFADNLYWRTTPGTIHWAGLSLDAWRALDRDSRSVVADPKLTGVIDGKPELDAASPAKELGFKPWDFADVGPRTERSAAGGR